MVVRLFAIGGISPLADEEASRTLLLLAAAAAYIISALIFDFVFNSMVLTDSTFNVIVFLVVAITSAVIVTEYTTHQPHKKTVSILGYLSLLLLLPIASMSFVPTITVTFLFLPISFSWKGVVIAFWCVLADAYGFSLVLLYFAVLKKARGSSKVLSS